MILRRQRREYRPHRAVFACAACGDTARFVGIDGAFVALCWGCAGSFATTMTEGTTPAEATV